MGASFESILNDFFGTKNSEPKNRLTNEYKNGTLKVVWGTTGKILFLRDNNFYYVEGSRGSDDGFLGQWQEQNLGSIYEEKIEDALMTIFHWDLNKKDIIRNFLKENKNV